MLVLSLFSQRVFAKDFEALIKNDICTSPGFINKFIREYLLPYNAMEIEFGFKNFSVARRAFYWIAEAKCTVAKFCELPAMKSGSWNDTQADALIHFAATTLIQYKFPEPATKIFLNHEIDGFTHLQNESSLMDLRNNQKGHQFGEKLRLEKPNLSEDEVLLLALQEGVDKIQNNDLQFNKKINKGPCVNLERKAPSYIARRLKETKAFRKDKSLPCML